MVLIGSKVTLPLSNEPPLLLPFIFESLGGELNTLDKLLLLDFFGLGSALAGGGCADAVDVNEKLDFRSSEK
jgi:hypothetical protein